MSDVIWVAIIAAVPDAGTLALAVYIAIQGKKIHSLVNSKFTAAQAEIKALKLEIKALKK